MITFREIKGTSGFVVQGEACDLGSIERQTANDYFFIPNRLPAYSEAQIRGIHHKLFALNQALAIHNAK